MLTPTWGGLQRAPCCCCSFCAAAAAVGDFVVDFLAYHHKQSESDANSVHTSGRRPAGVGGYYCDVRKARGLVQIQGFAHYWVGSGGFGFDLVHFSIVRVILAQGHAKLLCIVHHPASRKHHHKERHLRASPCKHHHASPCKHHHASITTRNITYEHHPANITMEASPQGTSSSPSHLPLNTPCVQTSM